MADNEERARRIKTLSHPPTSSGHSPSSVVLSDGAQAQRAQRGEEQEGRGTGRWSGSCGSHFIKQPGSRQRCSFRSVNQEPEFAEQNHAINRNHGYHHYTTV